MTGEAEALAYPDFCTRTAGAFVAHRIDTGDPEHFRGRVTAGQVGPLGMAQISAADHAVVRTSGDIAGSSTEHYKVSLQVSGTARLSQDEQQTVLGPGDFAVYDTAYPYRIGFGEPYRSVVLMVPKSALPVNAGSLTALVGRRLSWTTGPSACFVALLSELVRSMDQLDDREGVALADSVVDLLGLSLRHELGSVEPVSEAADRLRERVLAHIEQNLHDPELTPAVIAAAQHISLSRLHAVFRGTGSTVAAYLRSKRLAACHQALTDPRQRGRTISEIAGACGFTDSAHFSRLYRLRYGLSPRESRRRSA